MLTPKVFGDTRGFFFENFNHCHFAEETGLDVIFDQDNHSLSAKHVLRGMHYQIRNLQRKLVRVTKGAVYNVAVGMRRNSPTFGKWTGVELSADNRRQLSVPPGFAHGFVVLSDTAEFLYKTAGYWYPEFKRILCWNDSDVGIAWPIQDAPHLAKKDAGGSLFASTDTFE